MTKLLLFVALATSAAAKPNILFIAADDLRVEPLALTPNLDKLAQQSRVFTNAHCQQAVCNPSRSSLMTGLRPDTLGIWNLETHFRENHPNVVTLPQHFKNQGYFTRNIGKMYHNFHQTPQGDPVSWSVPAELHWGTHGSDKAEMSTPLPPNLAKDKKCVCRDVPDEAYLDGRVAARSVEALRKASQNQQPFFLAVGFWKPHSPFNAPKKYWDLYQRDAIPMPTHPEWPKDAPRIAWHNSREILGRGKSARQLNEAAAREIRHGYLANMSYLDAQIGKVLDELDRLDLRKNTLIVFFSDHGFHLGENTLWAKTSNFERDARVPLLISTPGLTKPGAKAKAPVELLDLYPTLVDLCGLPAVPTLEGSSLVPILKEPGARVKPIALTQHPRPAYIGKNPPESMGYSARTTTHRYTEWRDWVSGKTIASELYDYSRDPHETRNLAKDPAMKSLVRRLSALLPPALAHPLPKGNTPK